MFPESALLPISALQHLLFCERQCALIHIEGLWAENRLTVEGHVLHRRAHGERLGPRGGGRAERRAGTGSVRGLAIRSLRLGLFGQADVVEFHPALAEGASSAGVPFPVEYKRGRPKAHDADRVQLCAQALCLEEMLGRPVPSGALFYARTRRREVVEFDPALRQTTEQAVARLHQLICLGVTPRARREKKCLRCSLINLCLPAATGPAASARAYVERALAAATEDA